MTTPLPPHLVLYHSHHCPNCRSQEQLLRQLQQRTPGLVIDNVNVQEPGTAFVPEDIRAVPTLLIGKYRFEGLLDKAALEFWIDHYAQDEADSAYVRELLGEGKVDQTRQWLAAHPEALECLPGLLVDEDLAMNIRIALDMVLEELAGSGLLEGLVDALGQQIQQAKEHIVIDLCHYLGLIGSAAAIPYVRACLHHPHPEVQRAAQEVLDDWQEPG